MKPQDTKTLLSFAFGLMNKLDNSEIDVDTAKAQGSLIKQANNILRYELDRSKTQMKIEEHNKVHQSNIELRDIESV